MSAWVCTWVCGHLRRPLINHSPPPKKRKKLKNNSNTFHLGLHGSVGWAANTTHGSRQAARGLAEGCDGHATAGGLANTMASRACCNCTTSLVDEKVLCEKYLFTFFAFRVKFVWEESCISIKKMRACMCLRVLARSNASKCKAQVRKHKCKHANAKQMQNKCKTNASKQIEVRKCKANAKQIQSKCKCKANAKQMQE